MLGERWLNLELRDSTGAPLGDRPYVLVLADGTRREGTLSPEGKLHEAVPRDTERLRLYVAERCFELRVGLPPVDSVAGAQERLNHLHYFVGQIDGDAGRFTAGALERFQRDQGLPVTGQLDAATVRALREVHGS
ncbi:MAG: peptidoglycan-binding domain-containing protein [Myxococcota bacterium]